MALTNDDIRRISELFTPLEQRIDAFETRVHSGFGEVLSNFDVLFRRDERREQEYLLLREQINRLGERVDALENSSSNSSTNAARF